MRLWTVQFRLNTMNIRTLWHKMIHWLICESICRAVFTDYFWPTNQFACTVSMYYKKTVLLAERHWRWQELRKRLLLAIKLKRASCRKALAMTGTEIEKDPSNSAQRRAYCRKALTITGTPLGLLPMLIKHVSCFLPKGTTLTILCQSHASALRSSLSVMGQRPETR